MRQSFLAFLSAPRCFCHSRGMLSDPAAAPTVREGRLALALALLAGLRILVFALALPFFTNVDEYRHFDAVLKYARGAWPTPGPDRYEPETYEAIGRYGSPEYQRDRVAPLSPELPAPAWTQPGAVGEERVARMRAYLANRYSLEADQPPFYYAVAGAWLAAGRAVGLEGARLLYFVRVLGALAGAALVGACWLGLRGVYRDSRLVRLGTPLLLAVLPLDSLYYVTSDAFSPLLGGLGFLGVLYLAQRPGASLRAWLAAGLVLAAGVLTKYPNAAVWVGAAWLTLAAARGAPGARAPARRWLALWGAALLPVALWLAHNAAGGDLLGTAFKVEHLGWHSRPLSELWQHPIFTPAGAWTFVRDTLPRLWRGELVWYRTELAWPPADAVYLYSSLACLGLAAVALRGRAAPQRRAEVAAAATVAAGLAFLVALSIAFVFGETTSPSASYPFFVEGRLVSGVLLPFCLLYVRGIEVACRMLPAPWASRAGWAALLGVCALCSASEIALTRPVFLSAYNFYHLP